MSMTAEAPTMASLQNEVDRAAGRHRIIFWGAFVLILGYLAFSWQQFEIGKLQKNWRPDRASLFMLDTYAHKHEAAMRWKSPEEVDVSLEGSRSFVFTPETMPDWFSTDADGGRTVTYGDGSKATFYTDEITFASAKSEEVFIVRRQEDRTPYVVGYEDRIDALPDWVRVTKSQVEFRPSLFVRLSVKKSSVTAYRYQVGWEHFWFDFDSPLRDKGLFGGVATAFSSDRIDPEVSNARLVWSEFWTNDIWRHDIVFYAMLETIFMALIGTMIASAVGLPLAFMAARNVQPLMPIRFLLRRLFDLLRGIDTLIWSLIFLRAFGPGLFTGIFAIAFTDTGTLGKLMSEAIENADNKQREGIQSTGAATVQQHRFGILPQIMPVFISQSLYYLESNTRSATIIGALGAGGIGLQFLGALQTGNDFEDVAYYSLLVLLTVILMDTMSAKLRRALIGIEPRSKT